MIGKLFSFGILGIVSMVCCAQDTDVKTETKIAFLADVHFSDVYGTLSDVEYKAVRNPKDGREVLIRTMDAQLHSTRLFNENYFAFIAALDEIVRRDIKLAVLPGDFSDDGQPINIRGLHKILDDYSQSYDISFFLTTGNHDPTRPFGTKGGKRDFLGAKGKAQPVMGVAGKYSSNTQREHPVIVSDDINELGYEGIVTRLQHHGFFPKLGYHYWETPFSGYTYENYNFESAKAASRLEHRSYTLDSFEVVLPDLSYLVEPVKGLWLLALDGNVYLPREDLSENQNGNIEFEGAGIGYNQVLLHKKHLVEWTSRVTVEAERLGKTLIAFSHYPMVDFNDGATEELRRLLGEDALQSYRVPDEKVAAVFADVGLKIHFGGHMHLNDTGVFTSDDGNTLINVQVPSLAAYKPAFKVITLETDVTETSAVEASESAQMGPKPRFSTKMKVETVVLDSVPSFDTFFELYAEEHSFLASIDTVAPWNKKILASKNYRDYTNWHLEELIRLRLLPDDLPPTFKDFITDLSGKQLYILSNTDAQFSKDDLEEVLTGNETPANWQKAEAISRMQLKQQNLALDTFQKWDGRQLIIDFYKLRSADRLALADIDEDRLLQYRALFRSLEHHSEHQNFPELWLFGSILQKQLSGEPAGNFKIDLEAGTVVPE